MLGGVVLLGACGAVIEAVSEDGKPGAARSSASASAKASESSGAGGLPNWVGRHLDEAEEEAHVLDVYGIKIEDGTGQGRMVLNSSDWMVCEQSPEAGGNVPGDGGLTFEVAKEGEYCSADMSPEPQYSDPSGDDDSDRDRNGSGDDGSGGTSAGEEDPYDDSYGDGSSGGVTDGGGFTDGGGKGGFTHGGGGWFS
ncbi:hypothetical protein [Streptomyces sp. NBC_01579]|uniref:hypothetical protein n=1 Tax=Streptomyces sp. NBC_01579 TaxID=2975885 RepID=UPI0038662358